MAMMATITTAVEAPMSGNENDHNNDKNYDNNSDLDNNYNFDCDVCRRLWLQLR